MAVSTTFETLLLKHAAHAYEKQLFLGKVIGQRNWHYDLTQGKILFGDDIAFDMQLLGTEGHNSGTWLWAWANTASQIPPQLLAAANTVKAYGEQNSIPTLTTAQLSLDSLYNGHNLAMVSSGVFKANAYYRAPYDGGALFLLLVDTDFPEDLRHPVDRVAITFPKFIVNVPLGNQRVTLTGYLESHGLIVKSTDKRIRGTHPTDRSEVAALFDEQDRLADIRAEVRS